MLTLSILLLLTPAYAQSAGENPLLAAAQAVGRRGLAEGSRPDRSPTRFTPSGTRVFVERFLDGFLDDPREREALQDGLLRALDDYEEAAAGTTAHLDASAALAYAVCVLTSTALGSALDEDAYLALIGRFRAAFDTVEIRAAVDLHKQELYERALLSAALVQTLGRAAESPAGRAGLRALARRELRALVGAEVDRIRLDGARVSILGTEPAPAAAPPAPAIPGLASDFTFGMPSDWTPEEGWFVHRETAAGGIEGACVRFLPPMPIASNPGASLGTLWKKELPKELADRFSTAVYRRRVGDGLLSYFLCGAGRESGRKADTLFMLHLVVCKDQWQPLVLALTFEPSSGSSGAATHAAAGARAETFLAGFRCPPARNRTFASRASLAGDYGFGTRAGLDGVRTGALDASAADVGGTLSLRPDGRYAYAFQGDPAQAATLGVHAEADEGLWRVEGDQLVLAPGSAPPRRYRIAGLTQFTGGPKVAVLVSRLALPIHAGTLGSRADWYSTKLLPP